MCRSVKRCACRSVYRTDEIKDMMTSVAKKRSKHWGDLRYEAVLNATYNKLDAELKARQLSRKRKWEELRAQLHKKPKLDEPIVNVDETSTKDLMKFCPVSRST